MKKNIKKEIKSWIIASVVSFVVLFLFTCVFFGGSFIFPFLKDLFTRDNKPAVTVSDNKPANNKTTLKDVGIDLSSDTLTIEGISIVTAEENPENIWKIAWPKEYYSGSDIVKFDSAAEDISKEDRDFLLKYCNSHENTYKGDFLFSIDISAIDEKMHTGQSLYICGEYPEDFDEFAKVINKVCGGDKTYLSANGKLQKITPEYFTMITGITDDDVKEGTVSELIDHVGIADVGDLNSYLINDYIYDIAENYDLCSLLEYKIVSVPSSDEEWYDYSVKLADKLGIDGEITKEKAKYDDEEWYEIKDPDGTCIRVFKTEGLEEFIPMNLGNLDWYYQSYKIFEDTQGPTSEFSGFNSFDFTYSNDQKFAVAIENENSREKENFRKAAEAAKKIGKE